MLSWFRSLAKHPLAVALFAILALSFVVWQTGGRSGGGLGGGMKPNVVVQAGQHSVDAAAFKRMFDQALEQVAQQSRQQVSVPEALQANFDKQVAERVADDMAFLELIRRTGLRPSDKQVVGELRKAPAFFDPVTGRFDEKAYKQQLASHGLTTKVFEQSLRDDIAQTHFVAGLVGGLRAPMIATAIEAAYTRQGRSFSWFAIPPAAVGGRTKPTDAQLTQFMKEHEAQLKRPELRQLSVVKFSTAALAPTMPVDPAAVQKRFEFMKDSLSQPEKRTLVQIAVKDAAAAADLSAKLKAGADPQAAARAAGAQALPYAQSPRTAIPDRKVADAAFGLKAGEVSGPIQGDLGWAVVKVLAVTPGHAATLEEARPKIEAEVKKEAAEKAVYGQVQKYEDARSKGQPLAAAAQAVGVALVPVGPITAQGEDAKKQPSGLPPKVLEVAFKLAPGAESDQAIESEKGEYYAVRVEKVLPPALPPLEEIRPQLTQYVAVQDLLKRLQAKGEALSTAIKGGQSIEAAAATVGATVNHGVAVTREAGGQTFSKELLGRVFGVKAGEVVIAPDNKLGAILARVDSVQAPSAAEVAPQIAAGRQQTSRAFFNGMGESVRLAARNTVKPKVDLKRAREAAGGSTAPAGPAS